MTGPILGIETSCDETSAAVLDPEGRILGLVVHSQDVHRIYGGVVPELAARAHLRRIEPVVEAALEEAGVGRGDLAAVAATAGPGLIGALLVGFSWARAFAFGLRIPLVPVHHMEAHLFGPVLENPDAVPPFVALLVSGGHTQLLWVPAWGAYHLLGQTRDDAVGEAFDKVGKLLELPYPGGPAIEKAAAEGDGLRYAFPRPMVGPEQREGDDDWFDFSFSGLKTAVAQTVADAGVANRLDEERVHLAAAFQDAALDVLVAKTLRGIEAVGCRRVLLGGGVAANSVLRRRLAEGLGDGGVLFHASPRLSMDNAAMVARAGLFRGASSGDGECADAGAPQVAARLAFPGLSPWGGDGSNDAERPSGTAGA